MYIIDNRVENRNEGNRAKKRICTEVLRAQFNTYDLQQNRDALRPLVTLVKKRILQ
jgi:hypothetical protein